MFSPICICFSVVLWVVTCNVHICILRKACVTGSSWISSQILVNLIILIMSHLTSLTWVGKHRHLTNIMDLSWNSRSQKVVVFHNLKSCQNKICMLSSYPCRISETWRDGELHRSWLLPLGPRQRRMRSAQSQRSQLGWCLVENGLTGWWWEMPRCLASNKATSNSWLPHELFFLEVSKDFYHTPHPTEVGVHVFLPPWWLRSIMACLEPPAFHPGTAAFLGSFVGWA